MKKQTKPSNSGKEPANELQENTPSRHENFLFPIVGIGASAGGLEALESELREENSRLKGLL